MSHTSGKPYRQQTRCRYLGSFPTRYRNRSIVAAGWEQLEKRLCLSTLSTSQTEATAANSFANLPISFEPNRGQGESGVDYLAHGDHSTLFLKEGNATLAISGATPGGSSAVISMNLVGTQAAQAQGIDALAGKVNYLLGDAESKWVTGIETFGEVNYHNVYPGIDVSYHSSHQQDLEYDFNVAVGADPSRIALCFSGTTKTSIDDQGNLVLQTASAPVIQHAPVAYQDVAGVRQSVTAQYQIRNDGTVGFALGAYNASFPVVIDPVLTYSRFLGGEGTDLGLGVAVDSEGSAYITGTTTSMSFVQGATSALTSLGFADAFVAKLNPAGTEVVYVTFLGGSLLTTNATVTEGRAIAVNSDNEAYITGRTQADNFPRVSALPSGAKYNGGTPIGTSDGSYDAFVTGLSADGSSIIFSTYLGGGGTDVGTGIALNDNCDIAVVGGTTSHDPRGDYQGFPLKSPAQPSYGGDGLASDSLELSDIGDAFVTKIHVNQAAPDQGRPTTTYDLVYSTYLGGKGGDIASAVAIDPKGSVYVTGTTEAPFPEGAGAFPTTTGAFQQGNASSAGLFAAQAFVTKYNPNGSINYSTYLGGSNRDYGTSIAINGDGLAFIAGQTTSYYSAGKVGLPLSGTFVPYQANLAGPRTDDQHRTSDAFFSVLSATGSALAYSTYFGGSGDDLAQGIALDADNNIYIAGSTASIDLPVVNAIQPILLGSRGGFVARFHLVNVSKQPTHAVLDYSTYLGGSGSDTINALAVDSFGGVYVTGSTSSANFPIDPTDGNSYSDTDEARIENLRLFTGPFDFISGDAFATKLPGNSPSIIGLPITSSRGHEYSGPVAIFTPAFPDNDPTHFAVTIDWGDGFVTSGDLSQRTGDGPYTVLGAHRYDHPGGYVVAVQVTDTFRHVNYTPTTNVSHRSGNQVEPNIAIDPNNPQRMFVTSNTFKGGSQIYGAYSTNGGMTWTGRNIATDRDGLPPGRGDAQVAWDKFGNLFVIYLDDSEPSSVVLGVSRDGGKSFTLERTFGGGDADQPSIAVGPGLQPGTGSVWISYADVVHKMIVTAGAPISVAGTVGSFNAPQEIVESAPTAQGAFPNFGSIAVGPGGEVIVNWETDGTLDSSTDRPGKGAEILVSVDPDGLGIKPFGPPNPPPNRNVATTTLFGNRSNVPASPNRGADTEANMVWDQSDGPHSGRIYMAYTDALAGGAAGSSIIRLVFSDDLGKSWSQPVSVDGSGGADSLILPSIAIDAKTGDVAVGWYDTRNDSSHVRTQFFVAVSTDGGETFPFPTAVGVGESNATDANLDQTGKDNGPGDFSGIVFANGVVHPTWSDNSFALLNNPDAPQYDVVSASVGEARIVDSPPIVGAVPVQAVENQSFDGIVGFITSPDPLVSSDNYTAVINWGDGTTSQGQIPTILNPSGPIAISGSHTYTDSLDYPIVITVREKVTDPKTKKDTFRFATSAVDASQIAANQVGSVIAPTRSPLGVAYFVASNTESDVGLFTSTSLDSVSWSKASPNDPLIADSGDGLPAAGHTGRPAVATDLRFNDTFLAYVDPQGGTITILASIDGGANFSATPVAQITTGLIGSPVLAVQSVPGGTDMLWVAYPDFSNGNVRVASLAILNSGQYGSLSAPEDVAGSNGALSVGGLAVWDDGQVAVSFESDSGNDTNAVVAIDEDGNGPNGFSAPVTLGTVFTGLGLPIPGLGNTLFDGNPQVVFSHGLNSFGTLYAAYAARDLAGSATGILVFQSTDFGKTWGSAIEVFSSDSGDLFGPAIGIDDTTGAVAVAWYDTRNDPDRVKTQVFVSVAAEGTTQFSTPQPINIGASNALSPTGLGSTAQYGGPLSLAFNNGALAVTWSDNSDTLGTNPDVPEFDVAVARNYVVSVSPDVIPVNASQIEVAQNQEFDGAAATFTPSNPTQTENDFTATILWGDGDLNQGKIVDVNGTFQVMGQHAYKEQGTYKTLVTVFEHKKYAGQDYGDATVASPLDIVLSAKSPAFVTRAYDKVTAFVEEAGFDGDASKFNGSIEWGDGKFDPVSFMADPGKALYDVIIPRHTYEDATAVDGVLSVSDKNGNTRFAPFHLDIVEELKLSTRTVHVVSGETFAGHVGSLIDLDPDATPSDYTTAIDWGDGSPLDMAEILPDPSGAGFFVDGTHQFDTPGNDTVVVVVSRNDGPVANSTTQAIVSGPKLKLASLDIPSLSFSNMTTSANAEFQITGSPGKQSDYSASIDWGDASGSSSAAVTLNGQNVSIDASHVFQSDGMYTASLTIHGPDGAIETEVAVIDVASDVSNEVAVDAPGLVFNPQTNLYVGSLTLTNTSSTTITGPFIDVVLAGLPAGVTVAGAGGSTSSGDPYLVIPIDANTLSPGLSLAPLYLAFNDPSGTTISYSVGIYADPPVWYSSAVADLPDPAAAPRSTTGLDLGFARLKSPRVGDVFVAQTSGSSVALDEQGATISTGSAGATVAMRLAGANPNMKPSPLDPRSAKLNYLIGDVATAWQTGLSTFGQVVYQGVYPGIDLLYREGSNGLEYDFVVAPGGDPSRIAMQFAGASALRLDATGNLIVETAAGDVVEHAPVLYQKVGTELRHVDGAFIIQPDRSVGFTVGNYNPRLPLVIDPVIASSTFFGGKQNDQALHSAEDAAGNVFLTGYSFSFNSLPLKNPIQTNDALAFVAKFDASGALAFATFFGGSKSTYILGIATDTQGNAYLTGDTLSPDFPTLNPIQANFGKPTTNFSNSGPAAFLSKLSADGSHLIYSTYLGGEASDYGTSVAVDSAGNAYVTGTTDSISFPTKNALNPHVQLNPQHTSSTNDAFVVKVNPQGTDFVYATYLGSDDDDQAGSIAVDTAGNAYISGLTEGGINVLFPTTAGAPQRGTVGQAITFVSKLSPDGSQLLFSTLLGQGDRNGTSSVESFEVNGQVASAIAVDSAGNFVVLGTMRGTIAATPGAGGFVTNPHQPGDIFFDAPFLAKYSSTGQVIYITPLAPGEIDPSVTPKGGNTIGLGLAVDAAGNAYVTGLTTSPLLPTKNPIQPSFHTNPANYDDGFLMVVNAAGTDLVFSTYLGGTNADVAYSVTVDRNGLVHVVGETGSADFPTTAGAFQVTHAGNVGDNLDAFLTIFSGITSNLKVNPVSRPITATEGSPFQAVLASFADPRPSANAANYAVLIDWGDGRKSAGTVTADPAVATGFLITGAHTFIEDGSHTITVQLTSLDDDSATTANRDVLVADAPIRVVPSNVGSVEGTAFSGRVATLTDRNAFADASDFTAMIDWGDGTTSVGAVVNDNGFTGQFAINGNHLYKQAGGYPVVVTVQDEGGIQAVTSSSVVSSNSKSGVTRYHVVLDTSSLAGIEGFLQFQLNPGNGVSRLDEASVFQITGPMGTIPTSIDLASNHFVNLKSQRIVYGTQLEFDVAVISTGPGVPSRRAFGSSFALLLLDATATHTLLSTDDAGAVVRIDVSTEGNTRAFSSAIDSQGARLGGIRNVTDAPLVATGTRGTTSVGLQFAGLVATVKDGNPFGLASDLQATIDWGDGRISPASLRPNKDGGFDIVGEQLYVVPGVYQGSVSVKDKGGSTATALFLINVTDVLPPLMVTPVRVSPVAGTSTGTVVVATITSGSSAPKSTELSAIIDWGDGTTTQGQVVATGTGTTFLVESNHLYVTKGSFPITVIVTDGLGRTSQGTSIVEVAAQNVVLDGPRVTKVFRLGTQKELTGLIVTFNQDLDPTSAINPRAYRIIGRVDGRCQTQRVGVSYATYDASKRQVTLHLKSRIDIHHPFHFAIAGTGAHTVRSTVGLALDGRKSGRAGSDFRAVLSFHDLQFPPKHPHGPPVRHKRGVSDEGR